MVTADGNSLQPTKESDEKRKPNENGQTNKQTNKRTVQFRTHNKTTKTFKHGKRERRSQTTAEEEAI